MRIGTPINRCIYCGSTSELTDEHILPYSLWGDDVLLRASCKPCATITSRFEFHVARELLLPVRAYMGYQSRRKSKLPTIFPLEVTAADGNSATLQLPAREHPAFIVFPDYEMPGLLEDGKTRHGVRINGTRLLGFGADPMLLQQKYNIRSVTHSNTFKRLQFERFLAKCAYCIAVKQYGLARLKKVFVLDDILGKADTLGTYLGSDHMVVLGKQPGILACSVCEDERRRVAVRLKLFGRSDAPEYIVVVGRVD